MSTATTTATTSTPAARAVTPDRLMALGNGYWLTQIISSAAHYRFFTLIASGHRTSDAIAKSAGTDPAGTRMVLDSLVSVELLTKQNGEYGLSAEADAFLVDGRPGEFASFFRDHTRLVWEQWGHLHEALKERPSVTAMQGTEKAREFFPKLIRSIMPLGLGPADATAEQLGIGASRKGVRVIDIGVGGAAWSIPFARRDRSSTIVAFDMPEVLVHTRQIVDEFGVGERYRMLEGDLRQDDFGTSEYDVAILGNICHGLSPDDNRDLFRRIHRALAGGGHLVIADMIPNEERTGPPFPVMFAVNMYVMGGADTYTLSQYRDWLGKAGFADVQPFDTRRMHSPVILAKK